MNKLVYLQSIVDSNPREIYDTWVSLGGLIVTNKTKNYIKDTIFMVNEEGAMKNALVYCNYDYAVNPNNGFPSINWTDATPDTTNGMIFMYQGVVSPNFTTVLSTDQYNQIDKSIETSDDFVPFSNTTAKKSSISITDEEYSIIVAELGIPFLREDELEYNRDTIINICIKPAIDQYYAYFPIVIDEAAGSYGANQEFEVAYHTFAENPTAVPYKGLPFATQGYGASGNTFGAGAFNYMRSEMMGAGGYGGGFGFGSGIHYRKNVPGFTGMQSADAMLLGLAARQGYLNYFRREYTRDIFKNGKKYLHGYTSLGCNVNVHWLCMDTDYGHIPYWHLPEVRKLCTANALRNFGMLRSLIKPGDNTPIDFSNYTSRADTLEQKVIDRWSKDSTALSFAIMRGGL